MVYFLLAIGTPILVGAVWLAVLQQRLRRLRRRTFPTLYDDRGRRTTPSSDANTTIPDVSAPGPVRHRDEHPGDTGDGDGGGGDGGGGGD
jgi:hypothetical protein